MAASYAKLCLSTLSAFLLTDGVWLGFVTRKFYGRYLGFLLEPNPNWSAAGILLFVVIPALQQESGKRAVVCGAIVGLEHAKAVTDGYSGGDDQKTASELLAVGSADCIDRLLGNEHGHDHRFACTRSKFQSQPHEFWIGLLVGFCQMVQDDLVLLGVFWSHFCQPDGCFDRFDLAEERADSVECVMSPMLEQPSRLRRHLPFSRIGPLSPLIDLTADFVDDWGGIILLLSGRKPFAVIEHHFLLCRLLALLWLWDRCDELRPSTVLDNPLRGLAIGIKFPMSTRVLVGRVEYGMLEELVLHMWATLSSCDHLLLPTIGRS